jgi:hypothetical protein
MFSKKPVRLYHILHENCRYHRERFFHFLARIVVRGAVSPRERQFELLDSIEILPSEWTAGGCWLANRVPGKPCASGAPNALTLSIPCHRAF